MAHKERMDLLNVVKYAKKLQFSIHNEEQIEIMFEELRKVLSLDGYDYLKSRKNILNIIVVRCEIFENFKRISIMDSLSEYERVQCMYKHNITYYDYLTYYCLKWIAFQTLETLRIDKDVYEKLLENESE